MAHHQRLQHGSDDLALDVFQVENHLARIHGESPHALRFSATTAEDVERWRKRARGKLRELFVLTGREPLPNPSAVRLASVRRDGYTEEKWALDVGEDVRAPVYVLIPEGEPPFAPIMVFHGHSPSVQYVLGNYPDEETRLNSLARDGNYAQALAQAGWLVCAVEQRGFGERRTANDPHATDGRQNSCRHLAFDYMAHGRSLVGERCWDGMCAISFVNERDDVVSGRLGCTGNSGGGTTTLFLSALDDRITTAVVGSHFSSYQASALGHRHCECNYIPSFMHWFELGDVAALIAPRPLRFINGELDGLFNITAAREQFETVQRAYDVLGASERTTLAVHPEGHRYRHDFAQDWFRRWL